METITFRYLRLDRIKLATTEADNYLVPVHRLACIRYIWFNFGFPSHDLEVSTNPDDYDDQLVFNRTIRQLFRILGRIPPRQKSSVGLEFTIPTPRKYHIPWDSTWRGRASVVDEVALGIVRTTYLELSPDWDRDILELSAISHFRVEMHSQSLVFVPSSINLIASKMVQLKKVEWWLCDEEKIDIDLRKHQRASKY